MNRIIASITRVADVEANVRSYLDVSAEIALSRVDASMELVIVESSTGPVIPSNVYIRFGGGSYILRSDGSSYFIRP